jgi:prepilin peptidase CpaA
MFGSRWAEMNARPSRRTVWCLNNYNCCRKGSGVERHLQNRGVRFVSPEAFFMSLQAILTILLTFVCAYTDSRRGKIYNKVTYPAALLGLALSFVMSPPSPLASLTGLCGALALYELMRRIGGMGAGDVKLMAAVGALKGLPFVLFGSLYMFCIAGLAGLILLAWKGHLIPTLKWVAGTLAAAIVPGMTPPSLKREMTTMPFGPSIFAGTCLCTYLEFLNNSPFTF